MNFACVINLLIGWFVPSTQSAQLALPLWHRAILPPGRLCAKRYLDSACFVTARRRNIEMALLTPVYIQQRFRPLRLILILVSSPLLP
ncbi:Uncharacterized protein HZ326_17421 [Fusarium oxysporum f. sp. albedinis]|nr:Levodione reductase [Fusarium oxysporum f. sp. albedinis]KAJ0139667.1 Uncharacterized protein HZ326_17421 [Fusarium oxysporum f. sp. albedinis]